MTKGGEQSKEKEKGKFSLPSMPKGEFVVGIVVIGVFVINGKHYYWQSYYWQSIWQTLLLAEHLHF
jgi:hypothetical protein